MHSTGRHDTALVDLLSVFQTAMDQAAEAIVITDPNLRIQYVNPAAASSAGYTVAELVGSHPRIFRSGVHDDAFYTDMWTLLAEGLPWRGVLVNRRKNGRTFEETVTITPVLDDDGTVIAYVANKQDHSIEHRLQADITQWRTDRHAIVELMDHVQPGETVHQTATAFCRSAIGLDGVQGALVLLHAHDGTLSVVSGAGTCEPSLALDRPLPDEIVADVVAMTTVGPWCIGLGDPTCVDRIGREFVESLRQAGLTAVGFAPIRWEGDLSGILVIGTGPPNGLLWLSSRVGALEQLGSFAGTLLGQQAFEHTRRESLRQEVLDVMKNHRFHPVFQPVIDTRSGAISGYEALTRFDDGCPPDVRVAEAHSVGLGPQFEAALAHAAVETARRLAPDLWLGLNFSAEAILDGYASPIVSRANRAIVIEITEHSPIDSYPAVRKAVCDGGDVLLSVDDAGAGFASLRHVLELDPDIVKLDIGLIRGIDGDPARQALAAGMCHFAQKTGTTLVAEGVETQAEADMVRELGVELAQGYLFGAAEPLPG